MDISALELNLRNDSNLRKAGITTVKQITYYTESEFLGLFGDKICFDVKAGLKGIRRRFARKSKQPPSS